MIFKERIWFGCVFPCSRKLPPHPNVVQMFGVSIDGPQPVIVMEYCAGGINQIKSNIGPNSSFDGEENLSQSLSKFD
jgi:hypothetical protein